MEHRCLLILKTGETVKSVPAHLGDFEAWIRQGLGLSDKHTQVVAAHKGESLPEHVDYAAVVVTGSPAMVTERLPWSEASASYLQKVVDQEVPVLGICYGHQLLAHALGGEVGYHPRGREIGTTWVELSASARQDTLLSGSEARFPVHVSHSQSVLKLPAQAEVLASNDFEPHHAVRYGKGAWGVQFHPEFNGEIMRAYIMDRAEALVAEGFDLDRLTACVEETPTATGLLQRFAQLVGFSR